MFLPAVNPSVSTPIILPVTVASPVALVDICTCETAIAGIVAAEVLDAGDTFIFSPVTPVAYKGVPFAIIPPEVFFTLIITS